MSLSLSSLFVGNPAWNRPTHGTAGRCVILPGSACCVCVPSTATRAVIEMWGQGGGGAGACCCQWGSSGGQGGSYAYKVWDATCAPCTFAGFSFCGCVCACDCMAPNCCGHLGQFSRLTMCNALSWVGCVNGGAGGCGCCNAASWPCFGCTNGCNTGFDICCIRAVASITPEFYHIPCCMSNAQNGTCNGGSVNCCASSSCYCATNLCSATSAGQQHIFNEINPCFPTGVAASRATFNEIFQSVSCVCFDVYRLGACGWSKSGACDNGITSCGIWNFCWIGVGGAAYAGGNQEHRNFSVGNYAYCGYAGNFPGGGGKSAGACGGGFCNGSIGGGGLILISWT